VINQLWNDEAVRAFARSSSPVLRLPETTEYIFQNIHRIAATDYRPTEEDRVLFPRFPPGVSETSICVNSVTFRYFNVCGQRGERRKWIHIFEGVTAVVFCVDLTTYNKVDEYEVPLLLLWGPLLLFSFKFDGVFPSLHRKTRCNKPGKNLIRCATRATSRTPPYSWSSPTPTRSRSCYSRSL